MKKAPNNTLILLSGAIFILFNILAPSATFAQTGPIGGIVPCSDQKDANGIITNPCNLCHLYTGAKNIVDFMLFDLILPLAVVALLIGGIFLLASQGNPQMMETGKKAITNTVIGVIIAFGSWLIIATIVNTLGYKGFTAAWNEPPTCKESIAGTGGLIPPGGAPQKKFCVIPEQAGQPAKCDNLGSEDVCIKGSPTESACAIRGGTCETLCPVVPPTDGTLTHDEAKGQLDAASISISSSGNCSDRSNPNCTSL